MNVTSGLAFVPLGPKPIDSATKSAMHTYTMTLRVSQETRSTNAGRCLVIASYRSKSLGKLGKTDTISSEKEIQTRLANKTRCTPYCFIRNYGWVSELGLLFVGDSPDLTTVYLATV